MLVLWLWLFVVGVERRRPGGGQKAARWQKWKDILRPSACREWLTQRQGGNGETVAPTAILELAVEGTYVHV